MPRDAKGRRIRGAAAARQRAATPSPRRVLLLRVAAGAAVALVAGLAALAAQAS